MALSIHLESDIQNPGHNLNSFVGYLKCSRQNNQKTQLRTGRLLTWIPFETFTCSRQRYPIPRALQNVTIHNGRWRQIDRIGAVWWAEIGRRYVDLSALSILANAVSTNSSQVNRLYEGVFIQRINSIKCLGSRYTRIAFDRNYDLERSQVCLGQTPLLCSLYTAWSEQKVSGRSLSLCLSCITRACL